ncbi:MAG TPA: ABC transporter permease, partial [Protaetiibacter sp.]|nr:ABC transporter permease [Protaetiibacter sp.]
RYDLDRSIPERYVGWLGRAVRGDLGEATSQGERPVTEILPERAINTMYLAVPAFLLTASIAMVLAVWSALRQYKIDDYVITGFSYLGLAMPTFFFGILLQQLWGIWIPDWFGIKPFNVQGFSRDSFSEYLRYATLPIITLAIISVAGESRFGRAAMLDLKNADFIRTARAKGARESVVVRRHLVRNAMIPIATIWALDAAALMGGAVVTESIFSWPGLGRMLIDGIFAYDLDMVMAVVVVLSVLTVVFNLIADLTYGWLDPRIRYD